MSCRKSCTQWCAVSGRAHGFLLPDIRERPPSQQPIRNGWPPIGRSALTSAPRQDHQGWGAKTSGVLPQVRATRSASHTARDNRCCNPSGDSASVRGRSPRRSGCRLGGRPHRCLSSQVGHECSVHLGLGFGLVDPGLGRHGRRSGSATEPGGVGVVGRRQGLLPGPSIAPEVPKCTEEGACHPIPE